MASMAKEPSAVTTSEKRSFWNATVFIGMYIISILKLLSGILYYSVRTFLVTEVII